MDDYTFTSKPQRWHSSYSGDAHGLSNADVDRALITPLLANIDPSLFSERLPLRDIIKHDARLVSFQNHDILCRSGDYDNPVFIILKGALGVLSPEEDKRQSKRSHKQQHTLNWMQKFAQIWTKYRYPEVRSLNERHASINDIKRDKVDPIKLDANKAPLIIPTGDIAGEIATLARKPRTATLYAVGEVEVLQLRWQGLRDLMQRDKALHDYVMTRYRSRGLITELSQLPLFKNLSPETLQKIIDETQFKQFGSFDWQTNYKALLDKKPEERVLSEPVIINEGDYLDGLMIVSAGFCRLTKQMNGLEKTIDYLDKNSLIGWNELIAANGKTSTLIAQETVRAIGYVDLLVIPTHIVEQYLLPTLSPKKKAKQKKQACTNDTGLLEFLVDNRVINGTKTMVIDLERCVQCDECVKACESTHNGNPRFIRRPQVQYDRFMIANACMHCTDPVCLIGCPTGAIERDKLGGEVKIDPELCIGCGTCANNCPYDNILMVDIRDKNGDVLLDTETHQPIQQATKCDLCSAQKNGPACERACAHDALKRVNFINLDEFNKWVSHK
ncbi:MAG: hypothetical protein COB66_07640 [Coxiella sp. (in: Bacteria)]|nr:MAG: hypothetical protein COB66_07640 [Coxiella sp. (in: g-proteobacteria)]